MPLTDEIDFWKTLEEKGQFFAGWLFVVDDDGVDRHGLDGASIARVVNQWRMKTRDATHLRSGYDANSNPL